MQPYEIQAEIIKCAASPIYFINTYCQIVSTDKGIVPFKTHEYQNEFIKLVHENRFISAMMARQMGKSTTMAAYLIWFMMFNTKKDVGIIANEAKVAQEFLYRMKDMFTRLPDWLKGSLIRSLDGSISWDTSPCKVWNKRSIEIQNGSRAMAGPPTAAAVRGFSLSICVIDEVAHIPTTKWEEFYESTYHTISSGNESKIIYVSTPKGLNHFYTIHEAAKSGESDFKYIEVPWHIHPDRDEAWKARTLSKMTGDKELKFSQEHAIQFLGSAKTLVKPESIKDLIAKTPIYKTDYISVFENPVNNARYALTADCSEGIGEDYQAFSIIKIENSQYTQVFTFADNNLSPTEFAHIQAKYGKRYNNAHILVEKASTGGEVIKELFDELDYENIVYTKIKDREEMGLTPTVKTKRDGCMEFKQMIENGLMTINCKKTIEEIRRFNRVGRSYQAEHNYHDDLIMGLINFAYLTKQDEFRDEFSVVKRRVTIDRDEYDTPYESKLPDVKPKVEYGRIETLSIRDLGSAERMSFMRD
jgi:hypothetical protein